MHTTITAPEPVVDAPQPTVIHQPVGPRSARQQVPTVVEPTPVAGLGVAPRFCGGWVAPRWAFTGEWVLLHLDSGIAAVNVDGAGIGHAREAAELLGVGSVDWTYPAEILTGDPLALDVLRVVGDWVRDAVRENRPVRLHASSWQQIPPPWSVDVLDSRGKVFDSYFCFTYGEAEQFTVELGIDFDLDLSAGSCEDITISRLVDPFWELRCARRGCTAVLLDDEYGIPDRSPNRRALAAIAADESWRQLDERRWLCPACNAQFRGTKTCTW
ncbi:hypothetical protein [Saccharopolyspora sp. NPDC002686]|uniref:hypothetical protein n=1 Tax=Saccharopolyspora sp. NPDC002686 TaxID=3154541 RepID=UPI00332ABC12